jgi:anti-sigma factor RsiW
MMEHLSDAQLNEYLDNELTEAQRQEVGTHLQGCLQCQGRLESLEKVSRLLSRLPEVQPVHDLEATVLREIGLQPQRLGLGWKILLAVQGGTMLAVCLLLARYSVHWMTLPGSWEELAGQVIQLDLQLPRLALRLPEGITLPEPMGNILPAVLALLAGGALLWAAGNALLLRQQKEKLS